MTDVAGKDRKPLHGVAALAAVLLPVVLSGAGMHGGPEALATTVMPAGHGVPLGDPSGGGLGVRIQSHTGPALARWL
jgi:hypothetical protein